jgi:hypothetical protein
MKRGAVIRTERNSEKTTRSDVAWLTSGYHHQVLATIIKWLPYLWATDSCVEPCNMVCKTLMNHGLMPRWWDSESTRILWPTTTVCQNLICRWWYPATLLLDNSRSKPLLTAALKCGCMQCSFHCFVGEEENNVKKMLIQPTRCTEVTRTITTTQKVQTAPKMFQVIQLLLLVSLCFSFCSAQIFQFYW